MKLPDISDFQKIEDASPVSREEIQTERAGQRSFGLPEHLLSDEAIIRIVRANRAAGAYLENIKLRIQGIQ